MQSQSIDAIKPPAARRTAPPPDPGPPPSPRSAGQSVDGFRAVRSRVGPPVRVQVAEGRPPTAPTMTIARPPAGPTLQALQMPAGLDKPQFVPAPVIEQPPSNDTPVQTRTVRTSPAMLKKITRPSPQMPGKRKALLIAGLSLSILLLAFLGIFPAVGQIVLLAYGILALIFKVESRITFGFALAALALIPVSQVLNAGYLAESYAIFAYLLLFSGTISLAFELRRNRKLKLSTS